MSCWQAPMIMMLRELIGDNTTTQSYTDSALEQSIVLASYLIHKQIQFDNTYTVNISRFSIEPDPIELADVDFVNIVLLKCAFQIIQAELKQFVASGSGIKWKDGPSEFDDTAMVKTKQMLCDQYLKQYEDAKNQLQFGNMKGKGVFGPFSSEDLIYYNQGSERWFRNG